MNKKWLLKKTSALLLTGALALGVIGCANVNAQNDEFKIGEKFEVSQLKMGDKTYVIDYKLEDVTGDNVKDNIVLVGNKIFSKDDIFADNLNVIVQDGSTKKYSKASYENFSGYSGKLFIGDFNGDKIKDVMVSAETGGSGGIVEHMIAVFNNNEPSVIFTDKENEGIKVDGKFVDGFKAELEIKDLNKKILLDVSAGKDIYIEQGIYNNEGKLLKEVSPWIDPFSKLEPVDYDLDGVYELHGYQNVSGAYHADRISYVESILKFEDSKWNLNKLEYTTFLVK